jgi:hypothetical protein
LDPDATVPAARLIALLDSEPIEGADGKRDGPLPAKKVARHFTLEEER